MIVIKVYFNDWAVALLRKSTDMRLIRSLSSSNEDMYMYV